MTIDLPDGVEALAREKAARAGFDDVSEYVVDLILHGPSNGDKAISIAPEEAGSVPTVAATDWSDDKNDRRCELIDKDIQGAITDAERSELESLTYQFREYRRRRAPLPMESARRLHAELQRVTPIRRKAPP
jgi:hypothetical protein